MRALDQAVVPPDDGTPPMEVAAYFAETKREEFLSWHAQVTPWETERYLGAY